MTPSAGIEMTRESTIPRQEGCPFAALLAWLVLHDVLTPMRKELKRRALVQKQTQGHDDDDQGSLAIIMSYIDDCTLSIPYTLIRST